MANLAMDLGTDCWMINRKFFEAQDLPPAESEKGDSNLILRDYGLVHELTPNVNLPEASLVITSDGGFRSGNDAAAAFALISIGPSGERHMMLGHACYHAFNSPYDAELKAIDMSTHFAILCAKMLT